MAGILDLNTSSNSDVGLSGSFTPFAKVYDKYYFTPDHEPCQARYKFDKALVQDEKKDLVLNVKNFTTYLDSLGKHDKFEELLQYEPIEIVEKIIVPKVEE